MVKEHIEERVGGLYVSGTGVSLDSVVSCFQEGMSAETILVEFETLTLPQVYGAIAYYLDNQVQVDAYLAQKRKQFETNREAAEPLPEGLRRRLDAARQQLRTSNK